MIKYKFKIKVTTEQELEIEADNFFDAENLAISAIKSDPSNELSCIELVSEEEI